MKFENVDLLLDEKCPFCATNVPAGASVCAGCGATHCVRRRFGRMAFLFFVAGLFVGHFLVQEYMLLIAAGTAFIGAFYMDRRDGRRPFWLRVQ